MQIFVNYCFEVRWIPVIREWYKVVSGKSSVLDVLILFGNLFLGIGIARLIYVAVSVLL